MTLAVRIGGHVELVGRLRAALASRAVIDQAVGIIFAESRCPAKAAFEVLRNASQHRNVSCAIWPTNWLPGPRGPALVQDKGKAAEARSGGNTR